MDLIEVAELHKQLRKFSQQNNVHVIIPKSLDPTTLSLSPKTPVVLDYISLVTKADAQGHG